MKRSPVPLWATFLTVESPLVIVKAKIARTNPFGSLAFIFVSQINLNWCCFVQVWWSLSQKRQMQKDLSRLKWFLNNDQVPNEHKL